jgi:cytochrome c-type biogenesis protein CcmF
MFLVNNLIFVLLTFTVLIGTVFPLVVEAVKGKQMSVGRPYFDAMVVPVGTALLFLLGVGPALPWGRATSQQIRKSLLFPFISGAVLLALGYALGARNAWTLLTLLFGGYAAHVTLAEMWLPLVQRMKRGEGAGSAFVNGQLVRGRRRFGSYIVHAGAVVTIIAIAVSSTMRTTQEVHLKKGETFAVGAYSVVFDGVRSLSEPHRQSTIASFRLSKNGHAVTTLEPRMSQYPTMREPVGSPDVHSTVGGDLYLSLLNIDPESQTVGVNVITMPMVGWIWVSVILMGLGGLMALIPARRQAIPVGGQPVPVGSVGGQAPPPVLPEGERA